jgi:hypothetical protein
LQLPCQKKGGTLSHQKKVGFHWGNALFDALMPGFFGFVRFPTKAVGVS